MTNMVSQITTNIVGKKKIFCGNGGHPKKFSFTYQSISNITGLKLETVRTYAKTNKFNPKDLQSLVDFINKYQNKSL